MAPTVRNVLVLVALYVATVLAAIAWGSLVGPGVELGQFNQVLQGYVTAALEFPVLLAAGGVAHWLFEGRHRSYWVLALALSVGATYAAVVPRSVLLGRPVQLAAFQLSITAVVAASVVLGAWLLIVVRSKAKAASNAL
jgi:hypothetical protein